MKDLDSVWRNFVEVARTSLAMALSRSSVALLLCVCIGALLLVNVSAALEEQKVKAENAGSTTQTQFYLRGSTIGAFPEGTPLTEESAEGSADSFATVDVNDYTPGPNCRPKPCHRR